MALPLHILLISSSVLPNNLAHPIQILKTAAALARRPGVRVTVYCVTLTASPEATLRRYGIEPLPTLRLRSMLPAWLWRMRGEPTHIDEVRLREFSWVRWRIRRQWRAAQRAGETVLLYTRNENVLAWLAPAARRDGLRVLMELHWLKYVDRFRKWRAQNPEARPRECLERVKKYTRRECADLERADGLLPITQQLGAKCRRLGVARPQAWLPSGVELPGARPIPSSGDPELPLLYIGQLYPWKGVDTLIAAMAHLPATRLTVVGGNQPADVARVRELAERLGVTERIDFRGHQPHLAVAGYVARARVCVIPLPGRGYREARSFTSPMKLFEFAAQGRAIVASDLPSLREVLRHGENAWLVRPDDPAALAEGLRAVLADPLLQNRLGAGARALADQFQFDQRAARIEHFARHLEPL